MSCPHCARKDATIKKLEAALVVALMQLYPAGGTDGPAEAEQSQQAARGQTHGAPARGGLLPSGAGAHQGTQEEAS